MGISRHGKRAEGTAVEGMLHGNDLMIRASVLQICIFPGRLQSAFNGLRAAVGKENPVHAGNLFHFHSRFHSRHIVIIIGGMDNFIDLCLQRVVILPVVIAQGKNSDAGAEMQVFFTFHIIQVNAVALIQNHLIPVVGM